MIDKNYINELAKAINETQLELKKIVVNDGGTCNMDTVIFDFSEWKSKDFNKLLSICNITFGDKMKRWHKGYRFVLFNTDGMANLRNAQVEFAKKYLCDKGFECSIWYQMD